MIKYKSEVQLNLWDDSGGEDMISGNKWSLSITSLGPCIMMQAGEMLMRYDDINDWY